jgi:anti-sigma-K factor RskA
VNIQQYISSGIVESYILGLAEKEERAEFERLCALHEEVRAARDAFEILLEQQAMMNVVQPPVSLKESIFDKIAQEGQSNVTPVVPINREADFEARPVFAGTGKNRFNYLAAASVVLLLISTALNFYFYSQFKDYSSKYTSLLEGQQELAARNTYLNETVAVLKDPDNKIIQLPGVPTGPGPSSLAVVRWNQRSKDVYIDIENMPEPVAGKQYQLWAIVDGKPVSAGVIPTGLTGPAGKLSNIPKAEAFAITLEKQGGSHEPTMSQLYVYGNVQNERPG